MLLTGTEARTLDLCLLLLSLDILSTYTLKLSWYNQSEQHLLLRPGVTDICNSLGFSPVHVGSSWVLLLAEEADQEVVASECKRNVGHTDGRQPGSDPFQAHWRLFSS